MTGEMGNGKWEMAEECYVNRLIVDHHRDSGVPVSILIALISTTVIFECSTKHFSAPLSFLSFSWVIFLFSFNKS